MRNLKYIIAGLMLLFSYSVFAETYWDGPGGSFKDSPTAACAGSPGWSFSNLNQINATTYDCRYTFTNAEGTNFNLSGGYVYGTEKSCPAGTHIDKAAGWQCVPGDPPVDNKCAAKKGVSSGKMHWLSVTDEPSGDISVDGCAATVKSFICLTGAPSTYSCTGTAEFSGEELTPLPTGTGSDCTGKDCSADDPKDGTKNEPCIKQDTGAGYTCTSKVEDNKVGETSCGTANGVYVCTPTTKPVKTTVTNQTTQVQSANPDGSYTTKNVTTTTKTTCVADKCTETKYTTTTKGGTSGEGQPIPDSTECTGKGCPSQTSGGGGGGGGSSDDGKDDKASTSSDCAKPPECEGDTFMCALLQQNAQDACALRAGPTAKEKSDIDSAIKKQSDEVQASQDKLDSDVTGLLSGFKAAATAGGSGAVCYPDKEFQVIGHTIVMPFTKICDPLILLRYAVIAGAYLLAARILTREA